MGCLQFTRKMRKIYHAIHYGAREEPGTASSPVTRLWERRKINNLSEGVQGKMGRGSSSTSACPAARASRSFPSSPCSPRILPISLISLNKSIACGGGRLWQTSRSCDLEISHSANSEPSLWLNKLLSPTFLETRCYLLRVIHSSHFEHRKPWVRKWNYRSHPLYHFWKRKFFGNFQLKWQSYSKVLLFSLLNRIAGNVWTIWAFSLLPFSGGVVTKLQKLLIGNSSHRLAEIVSILKQSLSRNSCSVQMVNNHSFTHWWVAYLAQVTWFGIFIICLSNLTSNSANRFSNK